jgi:hypothetical protein
MAVVPIVRYMILCEDWSIDPANALRVNIHGLLTNIDSIDQPPYPLLFPELCVFLALTEGRGTGTAQIICTFEDSGQRVFGTPTRSVSFGDDLLWYNDLKIDDRPLRLR